MKQISVGKNFLYWHGTRARLVTTEPGLIKEVLNNKEAAYPKIEVESHVQKHLGNGLATSEGEKWFRMRKLAYHDFHAESLRLN